MRLLVTDYRKGFCALRGDTTRAATLPVIMQYRSGHLKERRQGGPREITPKPASFKTPLCVLVLCAAHRGPWCSSAVKFEFSLFNPFQTLGPDVSSSTLLQVGHTLPFPRGDAALRWRAREAAENRMPWPPDSTETGLAGRGCV